MSGVAGGTRFQKLGPTQGDGVRQLIEVLVDGDGVVSRVMVADRLQSNTDDAVLPDFVQDRGGLPCEYEAHDVARPARSAAALGGGRRAVDRR